MRSRSTSQGAAESHPRAEPRERTPQVSAAAPIRTARGSTHPGASRLRTVVPLLTAWPIAWLPIASLLTAWRLTAWLPTAWLPIASPPPASLPRLPASLPPASLRIAWQRSTSRPPACLPMWNAPRPEVPARAVARPSRTADHCSGWLEPPRSLERCLARASRSGAHHRRRDPATRQAEILDAPERAVPGCLVKALALEEIPRPPIGEARSPAAEAGSSNRPQA